MAAKRAFLALALVIASGITTLSSSVAAPRVDIRARTLLVFDGVRKAYDGILISGQLRDKLTGEGLGGQRVVARVNGQTLEATTSSKGEFTIPVAGVTGKQDISLTFDGGDALDPATLDLTGVEVDKQPLELTVTPLPVQDGMSLQVDAKSGDTPVMVAVELRAGAADAKAELPVVGQVTSGNSFVLTRAKAGGAGRRRVQAIFRGDAVYAAANAEATFELSTRTTTTFTVASRDVPFEERIAGSGKVADEDGKGIGRAPVTLLAGDRRLGQTSTKSDGTFRFSIEAKLLGQGAHALVAVVDTSSPFLQPSSSDPPVVVKIAAPQPVPVAFTAAAFGATAILIAGFFLARSRPWERRKKRQAPADEPAATDDKGEVKGGLVQAKPPFVSTLRRPSDLGVSGTVRDAVRGRPVADATVRLRLGDAAGKIAQEHLAVTAEDGTFAIEDLAPGEWRAKVSARGHVSERFSVTVPHRGELRGVRVDLVPVREQVFSLYRIAAQPVLPEPRLWGVWSPRQIVDHVRRRRPSPALAELTDFVEESYFSARIPDEDVLPAAREHVERAVKERDRLRA